MSTEKMLVLSTGHVTKQTAEAFDRIVLDHDGCIPFGTNGDLKRYEGIIIYPKGNYGWWIPIGDDERDCHTTRAHLPSELLPLIDYATANDCTWLMFDSDADAIDELPTFDW